MDFIKYMDLSLPKTPDEDLDTHIQLQRKLINFGRKLWDKYVSVLLNDLVKDILENKITTAFIERGECHELYQTKEGIKQIIIQNYPKIYLIGGGAYKAYDTFLNIPTNNNINYYAPSTNDYDILINVSKLTDDNLNIILYNLIEKLNKYYYILRVNSYITNFILFDTDNIKNMEVQLGPKREHKCFISPNPLIPRAHLELNIQKSEMNELLQYDYVNIRCSAQIRNNGKIELIDILEFNLTNNTFIEIPIKYIFLLYTHDPYYISYRVPDTHSLIKLGIYSLIRRGLLKNSILKCRKDFMRVNYFIKLLDYAYNLRTPYASMILDLLNYQRSEYNYAQILDTIVKAEPLLNHCSESMTADEYITYLKTSMKISSDEVKSKIAKLLDMFQREFSLEIFSFKQKYLKYKYKYIKLLNKSLI